MTKKNKITENKQIENKDENKENKELYSNSFILKNYFSPDGCYNLYFNKIDKIQSKDYTITNRAYIDQHGLLQQKNWCDIKLTDYNAEFDKDNDNQLNIIAEQTAYTDQTACTYRNCEKGFCLYVKNGTYEQFRDWLNDLVLFYNAYTSEDEIGGINSWDNFKIVEGKDKD